MRIFLSCLVAAVSFVGAFSLFAQQEKKAPQSLVFMTKNGNVTFNHAAHLMREKGDCKTCHPGLFQQDSKAPLNFKPALHKTAEMNMTSCGACHRAGGMAFESKGNCAKCHVK